MAKHTTITIETRSLLVLHSRRLGSAWCPVYGADVETIALEGTGANSDIDRVALDQWLSSGELHRAQSSDGSSLICLNSLLARVRNRQKETI